MIYRFAIELIKDLRGNTIQVNITAFNTDMERIAISVFDVGPFETAQETLGRIRQVLADLRHQHGEIYAMF